MHLHAAPSLPCPASLCSSSRGNVVWDISRDSDQRLGVLAAVGTHIRLNLEFHGLIRPATIGVDRCYLQDGNARQGYGLGVLRESLALLVEEEHSDLIAQRLAFEDPLPD